MTKLSFTPPISAIQEVQRRFEAWRSRPHKARRIPDELWDAAAQLCLEHSVYSVSRALRLNYNDLKERFRHLDPAPVPAAFAELGCIHAGAEVVVDCEDASGRRMRIQCTGVQAEVALVDLLKGFWRTGQ